MCLILLFYCFSFCSFFFDSFVLIGKLFKKFFVFLFCLLHWAVGKSQYTLPGPGLQKGIWGKIPCKDVAHSPLLGTQKTFSVVLNLFSVALPNSSLKLSSLTFSKSDTLYSSHLSNLRFCWLCLLKTPSSLSFFDNSLLIFFAVCLAHLSAPPSLFTPNLVFLKILARAF